MSDPNSVPGDRRPRVGRCVRTANLSWRQDLRTRLILAIAPYRTALSRNFGRPDPSGISTLWAKIGNAQIEDNNSALPRKQTLRANAAAYSITSSAKTYSCAG